MKAIVWTKYGSPDVLQLREVEKPAPKENEVLIKIYATAVTAGDCEQRSLKLPFWHRLPMQAYVGLQKPKRITIMGMDLAGEIEAVGNKISSFKPGDQVFAATGFVAQGAYAEYICLPERPEDGVLALKPANMTYEEAAPVPTGGLEALGFLRQGNIRSGQRVLINGAGGTIGTFAVQLARHFGAEVTGVDSTMKLDMLRSIGAHRVIDYTQEDFSTSGQVYDFILDVISKSPFSGSLRSLEPNGCYLIANPGLPQMVRRLWVSITGSLIGRYRGVKVMFGAVYPKTQDLIFLKELIEAGVIKTVIDKRYPLEQISEAHRYVEKGDKIGNVVINVA